MDSTNEVAMRLDLLSQDAEDAWLIATRCRVLRDSDEPLVVHLMWAGSEDDGVPVRPDGLPILTDEIRAALREAKPWT